MAAGSKDPDTWTRAAKDEIRKIIKNQEFVMRQEGEPVFDDEAKIIKVPASLFYKEKVKKGPFDPLEIKIVDIKGLLVHEGLALVPRGEGQSSPYQQGNFLKKLIF